MTVYYNASDKSATEHTEYDKKETIFLLIPGRRQSGIMQQGRRLHVRSQGLGWRADIWTDRHGANTRVSCLHTIHILTGHIFH